MNRIVWMVFRNLFRAPFWFAHIVHMGAEDTPYSEQERYDYIRRMVETINITGRVSVQVYGAENLPQQDGFIMFPNHQGLFDVLALIEASSHPFGVVIKKEAAGILLVKQVVRALRGIAIDRDDIKSAMEIIRQMTREVKEGRNYVIFPEGTRSRNGNQILPFKAGAPPGGGAPVSLVSSVLQLGLEVADQIRHGGDTGQILLVHVLQAKLLFHGHGHLHDVQGVGPQILKRGVHGNAVHVHAELFGQQGGELLENHVHLLLSLPSFPTVSLHYDNRQVSPACQ